MKTIVTFRITSQGTILAIIVIALILGHPRTAIPNTETSIQSQKPAGVSDSVSTDDELSERITQLVKSLDYTDDVAENFARMVMSWKSSRRRPALASWKERLANAHQKFEEGKISQKDVAKIEARVLKDVCLTIRKNVHFDKNASELSNILQNRQTNCVGFSQLTFIIGSAIGLCVKPINVLNRYPPQSDDPNEGHIACIVALFDDRFVMADAAMFFNATSNVFTLENHFVKVGNAWELKNRTNPLRIHRRIQLLDKNLLIYAIYNNRGTLVNRKGEYDSAILNYNRAIEIDPELTTAYNNRGNAYLSKGLFNRAMVDFSTALNIDPRNVNAYINRGRTYQAKGRYDWAIFEYNRAIEIDPEFPNAYYYRGLAYQSKGQLERAILDYKKAIKIDPKYTLVYLSRAEVHAELGKPEEAKKDLFKAIKLNPVLREPAKKISEQYEINLKLN